MIMFNPRMLTPVQNSLSQLRSSQTRLRMFYLFLLLLIGSSALSTPGQAQGVSSQGREFWVGFMPNYIVPASNNTLFIASGTANKVKIEMYGSNGQIAAVRNLTLRPDEAKTVDLPVALVETRELETPVFRAVKVTSTAPLVVYGMSNGQATTDGYLALPITAYGKEYYCVSYYDDAYNPGNDFLGGEFMIIAPHDGTKVTITLPEEANTTTDAQNANTISHRSREKWSVTLSKGQTYCVRTTGKNWGVDDLTGAHIIADKPIAFLTGHQRAGIELGEANNSKDHLIEMIPSVEKWGTEYFEMPMIARTKCGDYIRVISAEDGNIITRNGSTQSLNAGQYFDVSQSTAPSTFRSENNKRFLVMSYNYTQGAFGDPGRGDPDMITMTPKEQFQNRIIFRTPVNQDGANGAYEHYATIVCTKDGINQVKVKKGSGNFQALSAFGAGGTASFPNSDYVAQRIKLGSNEETYIAEGPVPFGIYMYGFTSVESYGWPAGMALRVISNDPMAPLESKRTEDCGDYDVELTEVHQMPKDAWDDTRIAIIDLISEVGDTRWTSSSFNYTLINNPELIPGDSTAKFQLKVIDKTKDAYAAVYTVDRADNDSVYEYFYSAPKLGVSPEPDYVLAPILVDQDSCIEITLSNDQVNSDLEITKATIMGIARGGNFTVTPSNINKVLKPGETFKIQLCFNSTDTLLAFDTLLVETSCAPFKFALEGEGVIPKIYAEDWDFGLVAPGTTECKKIKITNQGKYPLMINSQNLQLSDPAFTIAPGQNFPIGPLQPKQSAEVEFCFTPADIGDYTVTITYGTNIPARFATLNKNFTILSGISRKPGAKLTVLNQGFGPTNCIERPTYIDTLYNDGTLDNIVDSVALIGPGAGSYRIISSNPTNRIYNFVLAPSSKDQGIKYLVQFDPNFAGTTTAPQQAELIAFTKQGAIPITKLTGSRIAPVLSLGKVTPDVDLGVVKTNSSASTTFEVINTGTAVLNVEDIIPAGVDGGSFTVTPKTFSLLPGDTMIVTLTANTGTQARVYTSDIQVLVEQPSCAGPQTFVAKIQATENLYTAKGADYQTVFTCKDRLLEGNFANFSTNADITILGIDIINAGTWNDATEFRMQTPFANPIVLKRGGDSVQVPVFFVPAATGVRNAALRFTFELEGVTQDTLVRLTGIGDLVPQVVAVGNVAGNVSYTATMNEQLRVPIRLSESFAGRNANVRGYRFDISFKRDALSFNSNVTGPANVAVDRVFKSYDPVTDMETYTVSTLANSPTDLAITDFAAEVLLDPRVHRGITSDIVVSNATWLDQNGADICYIPTLYVPATYQFDPLCGDLALQAYLNDKSIKDIAFGFITPNPVKTDAEVSFDVNVDADITMTVHDALGNQVSKLLDAKPMKTGRHTAQFDASTLAEGTYHIRLTNGRSTLTQRLVIAK